MDTKKMLVVIGIGFFTFLVWALLQDLKNINKDTTTVSPGKEILNSKFPVDDQTGLVIAPGYSLVRKNCLGCHSGKIIAQNKGSRQVWQGTIRWMQETQNLWELGDDEDRILDYLATFYASEEQGRRKPLTNIDWYELDQK